MKYMTLEIQELVLDRHKNVAGLNWLMGPNPHLLVIGSQTAMQM
jgi:hypothetical protein